MKTIKITLLALLFGLFIMPNLSAQELSDKGKQEIEKQLQEMTEALTLDDSQQIEVRKILIEKYQKEKLIVENKELSKYEAETAYEIANEEKDMALKKVLTENQIKLKNSPWQIRMLPKPKEKIKVRTNKSDLVELEKEAYEKENITPLLLSQAKKLEKQIRDKDKETYVQLRKRRIELEEDFVMFDRMHQYENVSAVGLRPSSRKEYEALIDKRDRLTKDVERFMNKYDNELNTLIHEIERELDEWNEVQKTIQSKHYKQTNKKIKTEQEIEEQKKFILDRRKRKLLLFDSSLEIDNTLKNEIRIADAHYGSNTIEFEIKKAGETKIELTDAKETFKETVVSGNYEIGKHRVTVSFINLENGSYIYVLSATKTN